MRSLIIGIAGGSGSGKSTIAKALQKKIHENNLLIIKQDSYYKDLSHISYQKRIIQNFDHPDSIDFDLLYQDLSKLKNNFTIHSPVYDYKTHTRNENETKKIENAKVIIMEGIFALHNQKIRDLLSIKIYVDTPSDIRLLRRIKRDMNDRGRTIEGIIEQYNSKEQTFHISKLVLIYVS